MRTSFLQLFSYSAALRTANHPTTVGIASLITGIWFAVFLIFVKILEYLYDENFGTKINPSPILPRKRRRALEDFVHVGQSEARGADSPTPSWAKRFAVHVLAKLVIGYYLNVYIHERTKRIIDTLQKMPGAFSKRFRR